MEYSYKVIGELKGQQDALVDIELTLNGRRYHGTIATINSLNERMENYRRSGENAKGSYFCTRSLIILKDMSKKTIQDTLEDLIKRNEVEDFLEN